MAGLAFELTKHAEAIRKLARYFASEEEEEEVGEGWVEAGLCFFYLCYILALQMADPEFLAKYVERFEIAPPHERREFINGLETWFRAKESR